MIPTDTSQEAEKVIIDGYRAMSPLKKIERVFDLSQALLDLARIRIVNKYGNKLTERQIKLKLASLYIDRQTMIKAFNYDPEQEGY